VDVSFIGKGNQDIYIMKRKFKQFHQCKIKQTDTSHILNTKKKTMEYGVVNPCPGLRQAQKCGRIKPFNGIY
jgi:hypothetical protein